VGERVPVHVQSVVNEALDQLKASLPAENHAATALNVDDARCWVTRRKCIRWL
jgi:hypothetical protein